MGTALQFPRATDTSAYPSTGSSHVRSIDDHRSQAPGVGRFGTPPRVDVDCAGGDRLPGLRGTSPDLARHEPMGGHPDALEPGPHRHRGGGARRRDHGLLRSSLPPAPSDRAQLSWLGGSYLDATGNDDVAGFRVHGEPDARRRRSTAPRPLAEIPAYPGGILTDGYGLGGYGQGGFGRAASTYRWTSPSLRAGLWSFAVVSFDAAGNPGVPVMTSVAIRLPPRPPAAFPDGSRLKYAYNPATRTVTLTWQPSPALTEPRIKDSWPHRTPPTRNWENPPSPIGTGTSRSTPMPTCSTPWRRSAACASRRWRFPAPA